MNRPHAADWTVFVAIVVLGVAARFFFHFVYYLPNFAPVAGLALFAGFYFRSRVLAICAPLLVMLLTDLFIGGYHPAMMVVVYAALAAPVLLRGFLRKALDGKHTGWRGAVLSTAGLAACGVGASVAFFLVTNLAVWCGSVLAPEHAIYPPSLGGLLTCYVQALPFFRYTLAGDVAFTCLFFGSYVGVMSALAGKRATSSEALC